MQNRPPHLMRWTVRGARDRIRTYDLLLRRQTLYPLSYAGNGCNSITVGHHLTKRHRVQSSLDCTRWKAQWRRRVSRAQAPFMSLRPGTYSQCQSS